MTCWAVEIVRYRTVSYKYDNRVDLRVYVEEDLKMNSKLLKL